MLLLLIPLDIAGTVGVRARIPKESGPEFSSIITLLPARSGDSATRAGVVAVSATAAANVIVRARRRRSQAAMQHWRACMLRAIRERDARLAKVRLQEALRSQDRT